MGEKTNNKRAEAVARTRKMRARNSRRIKWFIAFISVFVAFALGFMVRGNVQLLQMLGFPQSMTGITKSEADATSPKKDVFNALSSRVAEMEDVLASDSLDTFDLDGVTNDVLSAFATGTTDPYVRYYSQERYEQLLNTQSEGYAGIGVLFSEYNGAAYVVDVFEGAAAQLAGVEEGDFVVAIDGDRSQVWSRSEVTSILSNHAGESVIITWRRPESLEASGGKEFTTTLECAEYTNTNLTTDYDEGSAVGYIKLRQLTQNAATLTRRAITELDAQGAMAFVLDLRDNPGGYLTQAVDIAGLFMNGGTVVEIQTKNGTTSKTASGTTATEKPLVVLVNKSTAAAAEVLAAALRDSQRATLVGTTTMGKGSVQVLAQLSFKGAIRYTAAYYRTPEGRAIEQVGISPNDYVEASGENDNQRDFAIEIARSLEAE
ncbi:MAG: PDZ domain-containing protein [Eggerthellaceae bacterium]|nr:PDZ domain-containing protein [Eggerthellaceae bacterium]